MYCSVPPQESSHYLLMWWKSPTSYAHFLMVGWLAAIETWYKLGEKVMKIYQGPIFKCVCVCVLYTQGVPLYNLVECFVRIFTSIIIPSDFSWQPNDGLILKYAIHAWIRESRLQFLCCLSDTWQIIQSQVNYNPVALLNIELCN